MNKTLSEGIELINDIIQKLGQKNNPNVNVVIAPPYILLPSSYEQIKDFKQITLAAQNCSDKSSGAYTGEISATMLKSVGCNYVIIGHSERRQYYLETNSIISEKVKMALANNISPVFCCGESLSEREAGKHFEVVKTQISEGLFYLHENEFKNVIIAYEPVWAIGTGLTASPAQANEIHSFIRNLVKEKYGNKIAESVSILYGGSCNPANAKEIFSQPDVDGGLIGGASLKASDFVEIINAF